MSTEIESPMLKRLGLVAASLFLAVVPLVL